MFGEIVDVQLLNVSLMFKKLNYDLMRLFQLDIVNKNFTSSTDARKILSTIQITQLAFVKTQQNSEFPLDVTVDIIS